MSELLNDSATAVKVRDHIIAALDAHERVLYVTEGQVYEPTGGGHFNLYIGAIIVTSDRLLVFESKALGRAAKYAVGWRDVDKSGRHDDGEVGIQKSGRYPIWKISIWEGKSHRSPLDMRRLDMLHLAIREARAAVAEAMAAEAASRGAEVSDEYEELKRRRGF